MKRIYPIPEKHTIVNYQDYLDFKFHAYRTNKIQRYWLQIYQSMPKQIKAETKQKPTNLLEISSERMSGSVIIECKFLTKGSTEELTAYLDKFRVFVKRREEEE